LFENASMTQFRFGADTHSFEAFFFASKVLGKLGLRAEQKFGILFHACQASENSGRFGSDMQQCDAGVEAGGNFSREKNGIVNVTLATAANEDSTDGSGIAGDAQNGRADLFDKFVGF